MHPARIVSGISAVALALVGAAAFTAPADAKPAPPSKPPLTGHLLAFNDFHGQIDTPTGSGGLVNGTPAGGVEYLAHYVKQRRAAAKASSSAVFTVAAGDLVGASPLVSAAFHDEPAVEEMNALGLDVTSVGNHEFDEGVAEVRRLQNGGCHPTDGCQDGDGFKGARYPMLAANVVYKKNNLPILLPFTVKRVGTVPVAFVGMTLEGTPGIVNPAGIQNVKFLDEATTAKGIADKYRKAVAPIANAVVGSITADIVRDANAAGESPLGDVIADGMVAYTASAGAQIAFMNPGGIRASLTYANSPGGGAPGQVTYGEAFTVQPFNNLVATVSLTGAQIKDVLEQQFAGYAGQTTTKFLQVSSGFTYSYNSTQPLGSRISAVTVNGTPIDPAATYRVTTNDFVANGGDGFTLMTGGTNRAVAPGFDVDSLAAYLGAGPVAPGPANRITKLG